MAQVFICSDLHLGHKNIQKLRKEVSSMEDNTQRILTDWRAVVTKRDRVYILGDAAFSKEGLDALGSLPGEKILVRGNHDEFSYHEYGAVFKDVLGFLKYKRYWLSHCPIHPDELRGRINVHGHVHYASVCSYPEEFDICQDVYLDRRYFNICPENTWPIFGTCIVPVQKLEIAIAEGRNGTVVINDYVEDIDAEPGEKVWVS